MTEVVLPRGGRPSVAGMIAMELADLRRSKQDHERQISVMRRENIELKCMIIELQNKLKLAKARKPTFNLKAVRRKKSKEAST